MVDSMFEMILYTVYNVVSSCYDWIDIIDYEEDHLSKITRDDSAIAILIHLNSKSILSRLTLIIPPC